MLSIAIVQFTPVLGDIEKNTSIVKQYLGQTGDAGLVVLPELASTGYNFRDKEMALSLGEDPGESAYVKMLQSVARRNGQFIVSGFNEKTSKGLYNSALLIGPEGIQSVYRKMHLFMNEKDYFLPGDGKLEVTDTGSGKIGMQICFDYLFPEPWRLLAMKGADIIVHPSNLLTRNAQKALPGIAIMNRIHIITANRTGSEGDLIFNGNSMLIDVSGEIVARASDAGNEVLRAEINPLLAQDKMITPRNHVFEDRRPEQYGQDNC